MSLPVPRTLRPNNPHRDAHKDPLRCHLLVCTSHVTGASDSCMGRNRETLSVGSSPAFLLQSALLAHRAKRTSSQRPGHSLPLRVACCSSHSPTSSPLAWSHLSSLAQVGTGLGCSLSGSLCMKTLSHPPLRVLSRLHLHAGLSPPAHPQRPPLSQCIFTHSSFLLLDTPLSSSWGAPKLFLPLLPTEGV